MEKKLTSASVLLGVIAAVLSFLVIFPLHALLIAMVLLFLEYSFMKYKLKIENKKLIINIITIYILTWFVIWTILYNLRVY